MTNGQKFFRALRRKYGAEFKLRHRMALRVEFTLATNALNYALLDTLDVILTDKADDQRLKRHKRKNAALVTPHKATQRRARKNTHMARRVWGVSVAH